MWQRALATEEGRKDEIEKKIKNLECRTNEEKEKILTYIQSLDNSIDRQIMWLRVVCCLPWKVIAERVGGENTEDSVRKRYSRLFQKDVEESKIIHKNKTCPICPTKM